MPIVTISRGTLSGGEALAALLSGKLNCPMVGLEIIKDAASLYGISEVAIWAQLKQGPGVMERLLGENRRLYLIALQAALINRSAKGDFVYHGLAGHFLLQDVPTLYKVRLVAPLRYRVSKVMEKKMLSEEEAVAYIQKVDQMRMEWTRFLYNADWTDPSLYDIVINLEYVSLNAAAEMIMDALAQPRFQDTPETRKAIEDLALSSRVKAKLALDERTRGIEVETGAKGGKVTIVETFHDAAILCDTRARLAAEDIARIAQNIPGVTEVTVHLKRSPALRLSDISMIPGG